MMRLFPSTDACPVHPLGMNEVSVIPAVASIVPLPQSCAPDSRRIPLNLLIASRVRTLEAEKNTISGAEIDDFRARIRQVFRITKSSHHLNLCCAFEPAACLDFSNFVAPNLLYTTLTLESVMRLDVNKLSSAVRLALSLGVVAAAGTVSANAQDTGAQRPGETVCPTCLSRQRNSATDFGDMCVTYSSRIIRCMSSSTTH